MVGAMGFVVIFARVFGGYVAAGGKLAIIFHSLPFEMMMIGGAATGAFLISNDLATVKGSAKGIVTAFRGPRWKPTDFRDLLCLLFETTVGYCRLPEGIERLRHRTELVTGIQRGD